MTIATIYSPEAHAQHDAFERVRDAVQHSVNLAREAADRIQRAADTGKQHLSSAAHEVRTTVDELRHDLDNLARPVEVLNMNPARFNTERQFAADIHSDAHDLVNQTNQLLSQAGSRRLVSTTPFTHA